MRTDHMLVDIYVIEIYIFSHGPPILHRDVVVNARLFIVRAIDRDIGRGVLTVYKMY